MIFVPTLTHSTVTVRSIRPRDARTIERLLNDNRDWLQRWEATIPGFSGAPDARSMIRSVLSLARQNQVAPFVIEFEGKLVGQVTVSGISFGSLSSGSVGYWIEEEYAGRGITPKAVALIADWCFTNLGLHRLEICIRPENEASHRIVRKLGFRYEGLRRRYIHIDGDWRDHWCFATTVEEAPAGLLTMVLRGNANERLADVPERDIIAVRKPQRQR